MGYVCGVRLVLADAEWCLLAYPTDCKILLYFRKIQTQTVTRACVYTEDVGGSSPSSPTFLHPRATQRRVVRVFLGGWFWLVLVCTGREMAAFCGARQIKMLI